MSSHGDPIKLTDEQRASSWFQEDPEMWAGVSTSMSEYLLMERALEEDEDE